MVLLPSSRAYDSPTGVHNKDRHLSQALLPSSHAMLCVKAAE
jgi:hypothetical protein